MLSKSLRPRRAAGWTLIELLVVGAIATIVLGLGIPKLQGIKQHRRLSSMADTVLTDVQHGRSEAARLGTSVQLRFSEHPQGTCYLVHTGPKNACRCGDDQQIACSKQGGVLKSEWIPRQTQIAVKANYSPMTITLDPRTGTATPGFRVNITSDDGEHIRHIVNSMGRIKSCTTTVGRNSLPKCLD